VRAGVVWCRARGASRVIRFRTPEYADNFGDCRALRPGGSWCRFNNVTGTVLGAQPFPGLGSDRGIVILVFLLVMSAFLLWFPVKTPAEYGGLYCRIRGIPRIGRYRPF